MTLSVAQMALMSRLLDEALPLDAAERRDWLDKPSPEYRGLGYMLGCTLWMGSRRRRKRGIGRSLMASDAGWRRDRLAGGKERGNCGGKENGYRRTTKA
jgi:hypothetical protein